MAEFADQIGLSRPTVSRYFNDKQSVRNSSLKTIEEGLERLDYRPNFHASNLKRRKAKAIGVIVPSIVDPFFSELVNTIEIYAEERGYLTVLQVSHHNPVMEMRALDRLQSMNVVGIAMAPCGFSTNIAAIEKAQSTTPIIFMDSRLKENRPYIGTNNEQGIPMLIDYLCRSGTPPAFFSLPPLNFNIIERQKAYFRRMETLGFEPVLLNPDPMPVRDNFERFGFEQFLILPPEKVRTVSTIVCVNDRVAFGLLSAAAKLGLKVGKGSDKDLRVAGHDDQHFSQFTTPSLTTVAQDTRNIGILSARALLENDGDNELMDQGQLINGTLMFRDSA